MFDIISIPFGWIMRVCYSLVNNYFVALLLFAVVMQLILLPFSIKQQKNSVRQAELAPKMAALRKKYAGRNDAATQQKMQEEMQELYKRENYNPASGCLPLLIQMPILIALYNVVVNPLRYITGLSAATITELKTYLETIGHTVTEHASYSISTMREVEKLFTEGGETAAALLEKFPTMDGATIPDMSFWNFDMSIVPQNPTGDGSVFFSWYLLIPVCTIVFQLVTQKITRMFTYQSPETIEAQKGCSMQVMNWSMPLLSAWIAYSVPAAIGLYWIFRGIIMAVQQIILSKLIPTPRFTEEDYKAAEKEMKVGKPKREKSKIPPKSLHRIDDEAYQAEYQKRLAEAEAEEAAEKEARAKRDGVDIKMKKNGPALKEENKHEKTEEKEETQE